MFYRHIIFFCLLFLLFIFSFIYVIESNGMKSVRRYLVSLN